jgi:hypothetical protein
MIGFQSTKQFSTETHQWPGTGTKQKKKNKPNKI